MAVAFNQGRTLKQNIVGCDGANVAAACMPLRFTTISAPKARQLGGCRPKSQGPFPMRIAKSNVTPPESDATCPYSSDPATLCLISFVCSSRSLTSLAMLHSIVSVRAFIETN